MRKQLGIVALVLLGSALFHGLGIQVGSQRVLPWHIAYTDTLGFATRALAPGIAYIDKRIEYPVIIGLVIDLAGKIGQSVVGYYAASVALLLAAAVVGTYVLRKYSDLSGEGNLWRYWIFAPSLLMFGVYNWDLLAVCFAICALYAMAREKDYWAAFWIALGCSTKLFPVLFLVPLLLRQSDWKKRGTLLSIFTLVTIVLNGYFIWKAFPNWHYFFELNQARNSNIDSIWTTIRFLLSPYFGTVSQINAFSLALFAGIYGWVMWQFRKADTLKLCAAGVLIFLLTNKIFSPQYLLWLLPFFALLKMPKLRWFYALEAANLCVVFIVLRWFFLGQNLIYFYWSAPFVVIRHSILIYIFVQLIKSLETKNLSPKGQV